MRARWEILTEVHKTFLFKAWAILVGILVGIGTGTFTFIVEVLRAL